MNPIIPDRASGGNSASDGAFLARLAGLEKSSTCAILLPMSLLAPTALALALLLPVVVAMYVLKLRREEQVVSSIYLWQRLVRDYEAHTPWQRLRRNLLLLLQLLFLTALILALARPALPTTGPTGRHLILIVDTSASMGATDVAPHRLEAAKIRARRLLDDLPDGARVTLIAAGRRAQVLVSGADDRRRVRNALDRLRVEAGSSDLATALKLAAAIAARQMDAEVVLLSDGNVALDAITIPARTRYLPVGVSGENQAISALNVRALGSGTALSLFTQVTNYGTQDTVRRLDVLVDGELYAAHELAIPAGEAVEIVQDDLPPTTRIVEARLAGADPLPADDRAWAVYAPSQPVRVLLVTEGNFFLETALRLLPGLEVTVTSPITNTRFPTSNPLLTIFDGTVPEALPPTNAFFVAPPASTAWFTRTGTIVQPVAQAARADEPLLRYVDLSGLQILEAAQIPLPDWARPIIVAAPDLEGGASQRWPLLFAGEVEGRRVAVLTFDLRDSDLVLRPAFPLLLSNLMSYLAPETGGLLPDQVVPGTPVTLPVPPHVTAVTVRRPDGHTVRLIPEGGQVTFDDTTRLGPYEVTLHGEDGVVAQAGFAVNLFSPQESDITPRESLPVKGSAPEMETETVPSQAWRELWRGLALLALGVLILEWLVYRGVLRTPHSVFHAVRSTRHVVRKTKQP